MSLFISYTSSDHARARAIKNDLQRMGHSVWFDHQINGDARRWQGIIQQIQTAEVFIFAVSNDSWQSRPCRAALEYAERLWVPVIPLQVGPLDGRIKIAERQIIDYRDRSADAVLDLRSALDELAGAPRQWPDPLPEPPSVPFEYLHRIASPIDVWHSILPEAQGQLIDDLRRELRDESDKLARSDILQLLRQLKDRPETTEMHAAEINAILQEVEAKTVRPAADGATRLPPAHQWQQNKETMGLTPKPREAPTQPRTAPSESSSRQLNYARGIDLVGNFMLPPGYEFLTRECERFFKDHPIYDSNVFLMTRFEPGNKMLVKLDTELRRVLRAHGFDPVRADDKMYLPDRNLWYNVCVYMLCCSKGIAILEDRLQDEFNPNVSLEYGFMRALNRPALLLADIGFRNLRADVFGTRRETFDLIDIEGTIQPAIERWLADIG